LLLQLPQVFKAQPELEWVSFWLGAFSHLIHQNRLQMWVEVLAFRLELISKPQQWELVTLRTLFDQPM